MQPPSLRARRPAQIPLSLGGGLRRTCRGALPSALKFEGKKRQHDADAFMADIVAKRLVRYLERARYVVMKRRRSAGIRRLGGGLRVRSKSDQFDWFRRKATVANRDREGRKWAGKQALPVGAESARTRHRSRVGQTLAGVRCLRQSDRHALFYSRHSQDYD